MPEHVHLLLSEPEVRTPFDRGACSETVIGANFVAQTQTKGFTAMFREWQNVGASSLGKI
jgi:hypothetical protein